MRWLAVIIWLLLIAPADAASRYAVATGDYNSTSTWASSSGGAPGASVPTVSDDVFFNAASGAITVTCQNAASNFAKSFDFTGFTGSLVVNAGKNLTFGDSSNQNGAVILSASMTLTINGTFQANDGSGTHNITTNGLTIGGTGNWGGSGTVTYTVVLKDDFNWPTGGLSVRGTINASDSGANHNVTAATYVFFSTTTLTPGTGTWTSTGSGSLAWSMNASTTLSSAPNVTLTSTSAKTFAGAGKTYGTVWNAQGAGTGTLTVTGANTFSEFKDDGAGAHTISFPASTTQTMTTFNVNGTSGNLISIISSSDGTRATLSQASGTVNAQFLSIKDSAATGGATWNATSSTDAGNNTGWNINVPPTNVIPAFNLTRP